MERELVANELDHRIKNLFALVNGLVALSGREDAAFGPFAERLEHRFSALHKAHEFIRVSGPRSEKARSIQALARAILAPYEGDGRIMVQGDDTALPNHLVTPFALVFHELATNSAKYGALACAGGLLSLRFRCADGRIRLSWLEEGISGNCSDAEKGGFGSKLLWALLDLVTIVALGGGLYLWIVRPRRERSEELRRSLPPLKPAE